MPITKWDMSDDMAQGQMTLCLDPMIRNQVGATSATTWTKLANAFGTTGVSKIVGDFRTLIQFRMSGSQHPGAEIEWFNMHLQRLKSNQVNIKVFTLPHLTCMDSTQTQLRLY